MLEAIRLGVSSRGTSMTVSFRVQVTSVQVKERVVKDGDHTETVKEGKLTLSFDGDEAPVEEMVALINGERILLGLAASQRTLDEWASEAMGRVASRVASVETGEREAEPVGA